MNPRMSDFEVEQLGMFELDRDVAMEVLENKNWGTSWPEHCGRQDLLKETKEMIDCWKAYLEEGGRGVIALLP